MTIYRGPGGSGDATNDATVTAVAAYAAQAATSATNAANSATTSGTSATNSANSASSAAASASAAANSASQAASSQSDAATSATTAANSATEAGTQATNATTQANNAANSATAAATSASTATTKAAEAETYAIRAETAETNAETAYANTLAIYGDTTDVANAVASANTAASNAATSASQAAASANDASDEATQAGIYAGQAASSASASANSAANSQAAVGDALALYGSATALQTAVTNAQTSATQSANSATASSASSSAAQTSANSAATSATNAANSATQAAASAASAAAIVTNVSSNRPSVRPSLLLDFQYTKQLDPRITFSRPTTATYYDGKTVVKAEENLVQYSQEFDNAYWDKQRTAVTANTTTAPDGTTTADSLVEDSSATNDHFIRKASISTISGLTYSISLYCKSNTRNWILLKEIGSSTGQFFDLTNGVVGSVSGTTPIAASIVSAGNGWYRCSISFVATASSTMYLALATTNGTYIYTGDGTSGIYIWGAQVEQRSTLTAYTTTTTAPITNYIPALQTAVSNDARFDHDPVTGESKGLLIEEQRTNLLTYSSAFDNAAWTKSNATITADTIVAPDGTLTGDKFYEDAANTFHRIEKDNNSITVGSPYTLTVYAKAAERSWIILTAEAYGTASAWFNLGNGTVGTISGTATGKTATITSVGNGWYRCSFTANATITTTTATYRFSISNADNVNSYTGDGYSGIYIWGAQLEAGSFPTSYIPTVASQVTRSADSASMTGSNFSSWFNQAEGTLYIENTPIGSSIFSQIDDGTNNNRVVAGMGSGLNQIVIANAVTQASIGLSGNFGKVSFAIKVNDFAASSNGGAVGTDTSGILPVVDRLRIGSNATPSYSSGTIKRIAYYPKRLSNVELQSLTS